MAGIERYYWFNRFVNAGANGVIPDDKNVMKFPDKLLTNEQMYWKSGIFQWMMPLGGYPSPHSIMAGQWTPGDEESQ